MSKFKRQLTRHMFERLLAGDDWRPQDGQGHIRESGNNRTWTGPSISGTVKGRAVFVRTNGRLFEARNWRGLAVHLGLT